VTDWDVVLVGAVVGVVAGVLGFIIPHWHAVVNGLLAGFVAGSLDGGRLRGGVWHGLLAGVPVSLIVGAILILSGLLLPGVEGLVLGASLSVAYGAFVLVGSVLGGLAGAYTTPYD